MSNNNNSSNTPPEAAPKLPPKPARELAQVLFDYEAVNEDELTIKAGEIITIISKDNEDAGWWKGELNGRTALFPDNFVEIIQVNPAPPVPSELEKAKLKKADRATSSGSASKAENVAPVDNASSQPKSLRSSSSSSSSNVSITQGVQMFKKIAAVTNNNKAANDHSAVVNGVKLREAEPSGVQKLVHLTAQRAKIPHNTRRPPSIIGSGNICLDDAWLSFETSNGNSIHESGDDSNDEKEANGDENASVRVPAVRNNSTKLPAEQLPYIKQLQLKQEAKRNIDQRCKDKAAASHDASITIKSSPAPPPPTGAKPVLNRFGNSGYVAMTVASSASSAPQSPPATMVRPTTAPPLPCTTPPTATSENSVCSLKNKFVPMAAGGRSSSNLGTEKVTPAPTATSKAGSSQPVSASPSPISPASLKATMKKPITDSLPPHTLEDFHKLHAELKELKSEFKRNIDQINAQHDATILQMRDQIEQQKNGIIKSLINDLAEEKKKIANIQIELDRLIKLNTTL